MRPEGFYETISKSPFAQEARDSVVFVEFIADAMLEGLKKEGKYNTSGYGTTDFPAARKGWFVFIAEEKG